LRGRCWHVRKGYTFLTAFYFQHTLRTKMLRYALSIILVLAACPVWAGERVHSGADELNFDEPFEQAAAKSVLRSLLNQALDLIENHIEFNGDLQPNEGTGEQEHRFQLKLFPHGKSQPDDHVSAELRFRSAPDDHHFSFDLKLPRESSNPLFYSPDNTL
jgi:hypothetical protein